MKTITRDVSGVNITLEYIFSLMIMVILFTIMVLIIGDIQSNSDRIVLKEEFDIISNDLANRISAFSSELYISDRTETYRQVTVSENVLYFDLPELVNGKQYNAIITYDSDLDIGTIKVVSMDNVNIYSTATFYSQIEVQDSSFYSQQGKYSLYYDDTDKEIKVRNNA